MPSPQRTCRDDLAKDLGALLREGTATDATLRISNGEEVFRAHRILLAARSPVFKGMLLHPGMAEAAPDGEVQVMDMERQILVLVCTRLLRRIGCCGWTRWSTTIAIPNLGNRTRRATEDLGLLRIGGTASLSMTVWTCVHPGKALMQHGHRLFCFSPLILF